MSNMNVTLTPYLQQWVESRVSSGRYSDASEVLRAAVRLLEQQEREHEARLALNETNGKADDPAYGTLGTLIDAPVSWVGDDLEECLALVYATRSPVEF